MTKIDDYLKDMSLFLNQPEIKAIANRTRNRTFHNKESEVINRICVGERELTASICRDSFFEFVKEFWDTIIPEKPIWNWHIPYLCRQLQILAERVFKNKPKRYDLIINVPPGTTKSTIISIMFPAWAFTRMPHARTIVATHTEQLGFDLSMKSRDVVLSDKYKECFPYVQLRDDQNAKGMWKTVQGGMRMSSTVGGKSPIGFHAHFFIIDDPIDPERAVSQLSLDAANRFMVHTVPNRRIDKRVSVTVLLMQRLHEDDPTGNWLTRNPEKKRLKHICLPCDTRFKIVPEGLKRNYVNGLFDPIRIDNVIIEEQEKSPYSFSGQYGQDPIPLTGGQFLADKLKIESPPNKFKQVVRYWDKAATAFGGKYTVGVKMGVDMTGRYWVLDVCRGQWDASTRESIMRRTAIMDGRNVRIWMEQEPASGGKESAENSARNLAGFIVGLDKVSGSDQSKEMRADPFASQVNAGNVYLVPAKWNAEYITEIEHFGPTAKFKDQVDASSGAFNKLSAPVIKIGALR